MLFLFDLCHPDKPWVSPGAHSTSISCLVKWDVSTLLINIWLKTDLHVQLHVWNLLWFSEEVRQLLFSCWVVSDTFVTPLDYSTPGFSVHGILQARILEWVAISFSRGSSWLRDQIFISCLAGRFFTLSYLGSPRKPMQEGNKSELNCNRPHYTNYIFISHFQGKTSTQTLYLIRFVWLSGKQLWKNIRSETRILNAFEKKYLLGTVLQERKKSSAQQ